MTNNGEISVEPNIKQIKQNLELHGFVLIPGKDMKKLLIQHGASEDDLAVLESGYDTSTNIFPSINSQ